MKIRNKAGKKKLSPVGGRNGIENHKIIAQHLETAAKLHLEAAKLQEVGEHEKAAQSTMMAQGQLRLASETIKMVLLYSFVHLTAF